MGLLETLRNIEFEPTPMSMGLLQMGAQMLANSSNQPAPVSFGSVLGHGINGFTQGAGSVMQQRLALQKMQDEKAFRNAQMQNMQTDNQLNADRLKQSQYKLDHPEMPNAVQEAMWAANGDPEKAKELLVQWKQNPFQALSYNLQLDDSNRKAKVEAERLDMERKRLALAENPKPTEAQSKYGLFGDQMRDATNNINQIENNGFDPSNSVNQFQTNIAGGMGNFAASDNAQKYKQAQEQWAEALLRIKTGAAASKDEVERNVKTYFPQLGDSPEVIKQKALARQDAENSVFNAAGPAVNNDQPAQKPKQTESTDSMDMSKLKPHPTMKGYYTDGTNWYKK